MGVILTTYKSWDDPPSSIGLLSQQKYNSLKKSQLMVFHILDLSVQIRLAVWQKEYNDIYINNTGSLEKRIQRHLYNQYWQSGKKNTMTIWHLYKQYWQSGKKNTMTFI